MQSDLNGVRRNYTYDQYGNRQSCIQLGGTDCQSGTVIYGTNNQMAGATYDPRGNLVAFSGHNYAYDALNMQTRDVAGNVTREYIYTADDERIAVYTPTSGAWQWTLRDASGKVLREMSSRNPASGTIGTASWRWDKDYLYRDGLLLASRQPDPATGAVATYRYHLDHLGTPRRITDTTNTIVGQHNYLAFGPELSTGRIDEPSLTALRYTGHERDGDLDYMHARYYDWTMGRFLSVDPVWDLESAMLNPQMWNRYSYALNNPLKYVDPTGEIVSLASLDDEQRAALLQGLNDFTGNTCGVDDDMNLVVLSYGSDASATASQFLASAMGSETVYNVFGVNGDPNIRFGRANNATNEITLDFKDWADMRTGNIDSRTFNIGSQAIHELIHVHNGARDPEGLAQLTQTGPVVDYVNLMRRERGMPTRGPMYAGEMGGWSGNRVRVPFIVDPARPGRIRWISARNY